MPTLRTLAVAAASVVTTLGVTLAGQSVAAGHHFVPSAHGYDVPPAHPESDRQIQNIDQVRTAIKAYYGDTVTSQLDPVNGTVALHTFDPQGAYAAQVSRELARAQAYLATAAERTPNGTDQRQNAIVLDVDDTSLNTYDYEIYSNFAYNPTTNAAFVNAEVFPAVPGMVQLATAAQSEGYTIFFLTGRPEAQRAATEGNIAKVGYPAVPDANFFLKDLTKPIYSSCYNPPTSTCTTTQYKSLTRHHIRTLGYRIVGNFGDQRSDLRGGSADRAFKLPNPMYYLP